MHIISRKKLRDFILRHPDSRSSLNGWYKLLKASEFKTFVELRNTFPSADLVGKFTVLNISGNKYRLIAVIIYAQKRIYVRGILTHAEYDKKLWREI